METFYVEAELSAGREPELGKSVRIIPGRARATEVHWADAVLLQQLTQKRRPDLDWQIERTYSGKYVVRGKSKA